MFHERGGGIIEICGETIINNGIISAQGRDGGGGSGGSIKIKCKIFENYGNIKANGGKGSELYDIGDGGSGYISIYCSSFLNKGIISPKPFIKQNIKYKVKKNNPFTKIGNYVK